MTKIYTDAEGYEYTLDANNKKVHLGNAIKIWEHISDYQEVYSHDKN